MKFLAGMIVASLSLTACSDGPKNKGEFSDSRIRGSDAALPASDLGATKDAGSSPSPPTDAIYESAAGEKGDFLASAAFQVEGVPEGATDFSHFQIKVTADPAITHFSYKLGSAIDCSLGIGYKVESVASLVNINIESLADGPVSLCILKYLGSDRIWQKVEEAKIFTWAKIPFVRTIKGQYEEFVELCRKRIITTTEIKFSGSSAVYTWSLDPKAQGCNLAKTEGQDTMSIKSNDESGIAGAWFFKDGSGWFDFKWKNKERTSFEGTWGYGDATVKAEPRGTWVSTAP